MPIDIPFGALIGLVTKLFTSKRHKLFIVVEFDTNDGCTHLTSVKVSNRGDYFERPVEIVIQAATQKDNPTRFFVSQVEAGDQIEISSVETRSESRVMRTHEASYSIDGMEPSDELLFVILSEFAIDDLKIKAQSPNIKQTWSTRTR